MNPTLSVQRVAKQVLFTFAASLLIVEQSLAAIVPVPTGGVCEPVPGGFPPIGTTIAYDIDGREQVAHRFFDMIDGGKIVVETSLPAVEHSTTTSRRVYTQHIHKESRQVIWTSRSITTRSIPGVLPQGDYTDLWIPPATPVGATINIQNQNMIVLQEHSGIMYVGVGPMSTPTSSIFGARMYDKQTGIFRGFATPVPSYTLRLSFSCDVPEPPVTKELFDVRAMAPTSVKKHEEVPIRVQIKNNASSFQGHIVDIEVYDGHNRKVFQQFFDIHGEFPTGTVRDVTARWTPSAPGAYTVKLGIFTRGWGKLLLWNDQLVPKIIVDGMMMPNGSVSLIRAYSTSTPGGPHGDTVLHAEFGSDRIPSESVLIDLELTDRAGNKVAQQVFDEVRITSSSTIHKTLNVPRNLPVGTYYLHVGIFRPGWKGLVTWHDKVLTVHRGHMGQHEDRNIDMTQPFASSSIPSNQNR